MTPDTQQARDGYRRPPAERRDADTDSTPRSASLTTEPAGTGHWDAFARPAPASALPRAERRPSAAFAPGAAADARPEADVRSEADTRSEADAGRAGRDASIVGIIPLLAILSVAVAGIYIAWRQGSAGGGDGGVVGGAALLVGAAVRLLLPARLAGLLATRKRATDVITLTVFGAGLLVAGLVLPR